MIQLRLTRKLIEYLNIDPQLFDAPRPARAALGNWLASTATFEGAAGIIFLSESTLYSFWMPEDGSPLEQLFLVGLAGVLGMEGFSELEILRLLGEALPIDLCRSEDRQLRGHLTVVNEHYRFHLHEAAGLEGLDLAGAIARVNRIPLKRLEWTTPADVLREVLKLTCQ